MTTDELQAVLDSDKVLSIFDICEILQTLKSDALSEIGVIRMQTDEEKRKVSWYNGEMNGFQIALDLLEHFSFKKD